MVDGLKRNLNGNLEEDVAKKGPKTTSSNPYLDQKNINDSVKKVDTLKGF